LQVMHEYVAATKNERACTVLTPTETLEKSPAVSPDGLKGALWSPDEIIVEAREAIGQVAAHLEIKYGVEFNWHTAISKVDYRKVYSGEKSWEGAEIYVCSGADFETLYPDQFQKLNITKCKLQMMRAAAQPDNGRIGPALCGSLTLIHYTGFQSAASLPALKARFQEQYAELLKWGIHVMVSQNQQGELTIGDSHEYGLTHDPFNRENVNQLILDYFKTFADIKQLQIIQHWNGVYPKMTDGNTEVVIIPQKGVTIINGIGGAGMTLSFGTAEEVINGNISPINI
jgi:FAD dependent oxidoreductase TIGR03364